MKKLEQKWSGPEHIETVQTHMNCQTAWAIGTYDYDKGPSFRRLINMDSGSPNRVPEVQGSVCKRHSRDFEQ